MTIIDFISIIFVILVIFIQSSPAPEKRYRKAKITKRYLDAVKMTDQFYKLNPEIPDHRKKVRRK